ncbi:exported hypothetical protein [Streptomyces misionensis JCM 4497]
MRPSATSTARSTASRATAPSTTRGRCCPSRRRPCPRSARTAPSSRRRSRRTRRRTPRPPRRTTRATAVTSSPPPPPRPTTPTATPEGGHAGNGGAGGCPHDRREQLLRLRIRPRTRRLDADLRPRLRHPPPRLAHDAGRPRAVAAGLAAGVLGDPQPHRDQPGRPVLLPGTPPDEPGHRGRPDDRHPLAGPPSPAQRGADPLRRLRHARPGGAHPARRHHQRPAQLDRDRRLLRPARRIPQDRDHPRHGDAAVRAGRRGRQAVPRPPHGGAGPRARGRAVHDPAADAGPRLGAGDGGHHPGRAARLGRLQPLDLRPARHRCDRLHRHLAAAHPGPVPDQPLRGLRQPRPRPGRRRLQHQPGPHRHRLRRADRRRPLPRLADHRPVRARAADRLRVHGRGRGTGLRRRRVHHLPDRRHPVAGLPDRPGLDGAVRDDRRRGHRGLVRLPGVREHRHDPRHHAGHRSAAAVRLLRRLLDVRGLGGGRTTPVDQGAAAHVGVRKLPPGAGAH